MGVNIVVYKVTKDPYSSDRIPETQWDYIRQGFDSNFKFKTECDYSGSDPDVYSGFICQRPINCDVEADLIRQTIPTQYQDRYLYLCELLKNNPDYYVHWSW